MTDIIVRAVGIQCAECKKEIGFLVTEHIRTDEVIKFLNANEVFGMCHDCGIYFNIGQKEEKEK